MSRTLEHLGDEAGAREHAEEAACLDDERFPIPLEMTDEEFDQLVERSLAELPEPVRKHLEELPVIVERLPSPNSSPATIRCPPTSSACSSAATS